MKPGSVSSAERTPPPTSSFASYTATLRLDRAISTAAARPFGPAPTTTASGTRLQVPVEPLGGAAPRVDQVLASAEAVALALVHVIVVGLPRGPQGAHHLLCLAARDAWIVLALDDQERRADLRDVRQRRPVAIALRVTGRVAKLAREVLAQVTAGRVVHRLPRDHADQRDAGRKALRGEGEREERHVAAVAPAVCADALGIGDLLADQPLDAFGDVLEILAAPVAAIGLLELATVAGRAAHVRREHDVAVVREVLAR